jgi:LytS/YehU family sensor histidine kinase
LVYIRKWFHNSEELRLQNELLQKDFELLTTNKELLEKQNQLNLYKMQTLNWQIKPHFLFNALNNIYIKTMRNPSSVGDAVLQFSDTLRYIVYDCLSERVPLSNEIDFVCNYLDLSLQGLPPDTYKLELDIADIPENVQIMPLIIITFVENAVKYGIQKTDTNKWIKMVLHLENSALHLKISNSQATGITGRDMQSSGKGIANTRERLKIGYPNQHQLILNSAGNMFEVDLTIELN